MFTKIKQYVGDRLWFFYLSMTLSGLNGIVALLPFVFVWLVVRGLLTPALQSTPDDISTYAWWAVGLTICSILLYFFALMSSHLAAFRVEMNLRKAGMARLMKMPLGFFESRETGRLRKILDEDTSLTHTFLAHVLPDFAASLTAPICIVALMFIIDWRFGLVSMVPLIASAGILLYMMDPRKNKFFSLQLDAQERMGGQAVEYVRGIPVIKVFRQTVYSFRKFYQSIVDYKDFSMKYVLGWRKPFSFYLAIVNSFMLLLVPAAIIIIGRDLSPDKAVANMLLYAIIVPLIASNIMKIMHMFEGLMSVQAAIDRVEKMTDVEPLSTPDHPRTPESYAICFQGVSFTYPGAPQPAIDGIDLMIEEGKTYALVGPSGSGKTTLARLIPRFWDVDTGTVSIGGVDVKDIAQDELMNIVSFVFQKNTLLKRSIRENILFGNPLASDDELQRAVDLSQSRSIVDRLPQGLDTVIGTKGTYLSGGEQQRIILARAILKGAPISVYDEATAFADPENEHMIQLALDELSKGRTTIMIAHRLNSIKDADCIVVMDEGKIAEQGFFDDLVANNGLFASLWREYQQSSSWTF